MRSGAQKCPRNPGTTLVVQAGGWEKTRPPSCQVFRSGECRDRIPGPVEKKTIGASIFNDGRGIVNKQVAVAKLRSGGVAMLLVSPSAAEIPMSDQAVIPTITPG